MIHVVIQIFDVVRYRQISIGFSSQHDFETRWQRVEHYY